MSIAALIVAAGRGTRAGGPEPKQWQPLAGARVIDHTLAAFERHPQVTEIVLVLHPEDMDRAPGFTARGITVCPGGAERAASDTASSSASGQPYRMFSRRVSAKSTGS